MSPLKQAMGDYLALRRSLGHKLAETERQLTKFVTYLDFIGAETVTMDAALAFVFDPDIDPASTIPSRRLSAVRGFARHLAGSDPTTQIPPAGLVTYRRRRRTPFLFSEGDVVDLIAAARATTPYPLRAVMLETLIGLLAVTGMRVGEAIRLERTDIDWADAVIEVRATKFGKSRNVPVAPTTIDALAAYAELRDDAMGRVASPTTRLFVSLPGTPVAYSYFLRTFNKALVISGVGAGSPVKPHVHDLRHSFAMRTLTGWCRDRLDIDVLMPQLSTYLGHREPRYTYWYLTATPELLGHAAGRLEAHRQAVTS